MSKPAMAHRDKEFSAINAEIRELLKYLFQSDYDVAVISGSGTAGLEAVISNLLIKGDKVVNIINGKFGERLNELCKVFARPSPIITEWGTAVDLGKLSAILEENDGIKAITLCHNETSTGLTNQAEEVGKLAKKHGLLYVLDGITSIGGLPVKMKEWGVDVAILGSQKCIAAPAGMACLSVSERAYGLLHSEHSYYLNLKKHIDRLRDKDQTPYTPAIPLFLALKEALLMIKEEGLENRLNRIEKMANATRKAVKALGLDLFPDENYASNTVTAINYPEGISDQDFRNILKEKHRVIVAGAQSHIKGKVFRIGHMGICSFTDLLATFGAIEATLTELGYKVEKGSGVGAIADFM
ncbi:MAG: alanine--glyoxylate aminotransferase family protein [Thermoplasmata archaeon]